MTKNKPWWEAKYQIQSDAPDAFKIGRPNPEICELVNRLPANAKTLDLGCGDGRNAVFLAQNGLQVKAIDNSTAEPSSHRS